MKKQIPKINTVHFAYNGDAAAFDAFMELMITNFLNSGASLSPSIEHITAPAESIPESA